MDKRLELTLLYDFYECLLTDKQKKYFEMYYQMDLSLSEIGEEENISPQAVRDMLKRIVKNIEAYEKKLNLLEKHLKQQDEIKNINLIIENLINYKNENLVLKNECIEKIYEIKEKVTLLGN